MYVYAVVDEAGHKRDYFELRQRMSDPALTEHPETGEPVVRVPQVPNLVLKSAGSKGTEGLVQRGFTRYEKAGDGTYVKTGGPAQAPDTIKR